MEGMPTKARHDKSGSIQFLTNINLMGETEGFICAIQDQVVSTRAYRRHILKQNIPTDKCRVCHKISESIQHISSGCESLASVHYTERHDNIAKIIHLEMLKYLKIKNPEKKYYEYRLQELEENEHHKVYWNTQIQTDRSVVHNKPDIVWIDKNEKKAYLIDVAVPLDHNVVKTAKEKISKYQDLAFDMRQTYHLKATRVIPLVISSNGLVHIDFEKNLKELKLPENIISQCIKAAILGTVNIVRRVMNMEP